VHWTLDRMPRALVLSLAPMLITRLVSNRNEEVLIIYFYCFHLEEFAKEEVSGRECSTRNWDLTISAQFDS
jgi:hypothetical protein